MQSIGRYQQLTKIGEGKYLADDPLLSRKVLIETYPVDAPGLMRWANDRAKLRSPLVERLLDVGVNEHCSYHIVEHVEGQSLAEIGLRAEHLPALRRALEVIHEAGFQHGDLRLENIIITPDGTLRLIGLTRSDQPDEVAFRALLEH